MTLHLSKKKIKKKSVF